ncbi:MAG: hypothetical protein OXF09_04950 [Hyphomicrobiales bacterium]|nr:hypothetical protein [Hyphomicrobiales bacterium]MCY4038787.1 hypothetical protein [Hyphomicrobiales bacterium]
MFKKYWDVYLVIILSFESWWLIDAKIKGEPFFTPEVVTNILIASAVAIVALVIYGRLKERWRGR